LGWKPWESGEPVPNGSGWFGTARVQKFEFELKTEKLSIKSQKYFKLQRI
jgi:hypothetical protein